MSAAEMILSAKRGRRRIEVDDAGDGEVMIYDERDLVGRMIHRDGLVEAAIAEGDVLVTIGLFQGRRAAAAILARRDSS